MRRLYHLIPRSEWEQLPDGPYRAASLATEGFIHCSNADQVARVANLFFAAQHDMLVLTIAAERLTSPLCDEDIGTGERFPHVHGPIERAAILEVTPLRRDGSGQWTFPGPG